MVVTIMQEKKVKITTTVQLFCCCCCCCGGIPDILPDLVMADSHLQYQTSLPWHTTTTIMYYLQG